MKRDEISLREFIVRRHKFREQKKVASHAGVFRGGMKNELPLKTPAWEAKKKADKEPYEGKGLSPDEFY